MHVHEEVLRTANRLAEPNGMFHLSEVVRELRHLNESTVRTHIVSRCCVNAPQNHPHKWDYFRRVDRGRYEIMPQHREPSKSLPQPSRAEDSPVTPITARPLRSTVHAVIQRDGEYYVAECLELPVVTQGESLDEAVKNLHEALCLHLEGEDLESMGLASELRIEVIYDMGLACPA